MNKESSHYDKGSNNITGN